MPLDTDLFGLRAFWKALYFAVLGSCTLPICTTILRLLNNLLIFRGAQNDRYVTGKLHFSTVFGHRVSALGYLWVAALYLLLALVLGDWFCLGGAAGCVLTARHSFRISIRVGTASPDRSIPFAFFF